MRNKFENLDDYDDDMDDFEDEMDSFEDRMDRLNEERERAIERAERASEAFEFIRDCTPDIGYMALDIAGDIIQNIFDN